MMLVDHRLKGLTIAMYNKYIRLRDIKVITYSPVCLFKKKTIKMKQSLLIKKKGMYNKHLKPLSMSMPS